MKHPLFPYVDTCEGCSGYGRDHEGARCQGCGGNGVGPQGGLHPRAAKIAQVVPVARLSPPRSIWPHMDPLVTYDPMRVHKHGISND